MAALSRMAEGKHSFYDWQAGNGCGYSAKAMEEEWKSGTEILRDIRKIGIKEKKDVHVTWTLCGGLTSGSSFRRSGLAVPSGAAHRELDLLGGETVEETCAAPISLAAGGVLWVLTAALAFLLPFALLVSCRGDPSGAPVPAGDILVLPDPGGAVPGLREQEGVRPAERARDLPGARKGGLHDRGQGNAGAHGRRVSRRRPWRLWRRMPLTG